jgi:hypothetical protein
LEKQPNVEMMREGSPIEGEREEGMKMKMFPQTEGHSPLLFTQSPPSSAGWFVPSRMLPFLADDDYIKGRTGGRNPLLPPPKWAAKIKWAHRSPP